MSEDHVVAANYVSGQLTLAEREAADAHMEECAHCRASVRAARRSSNQRALHETSSGVISFAGQLLQGSLLLIAPSLRQLGGDSAPAAPAEAASDEAPVIVEPLRVLQPQVAAGARRMRRFVGRFGLVLLLTILVLLIPRPDGLSAEGHRALAGLVFTASILALEPVSLPIAALMVPLALVALGVAESEVAFQPFSRPVVFLILSSLFLAEGLRKHGLTRRLALQTLVLTGGRVSRVLLGLMLIAAGFSMWVENTATAAVLIPVALTVAAQVPDPDRAKPLLIMLVMGIAYSASLGGMATVMGAGSNAVAAGFLSQIRPWSFLDWMKYGLPPLVVLFPITWLLLQRLVRVDLDVLDVSAVAGQVEEMGAMSGPERQLLYTMAATIVLWVGGSFLESALGLPSTLLAPAMVAVMAVSYLAIRGIINWEDVKGVSWGIFFTIGAGLALGQTLTATGATDWFNTLVSPLVTGLPLIVSLMALVYLSALLTNVMNNTTIAAVFVPVFIALALDEPDLNPALLVMAVSLATTFGYSLPSASGRMALVAASGIVSRGDMMRYGLVATVISAFILGLYFFVLATLGLI